MSRELFAEMAAAPDDPTAYLVHADALQQRGDPRGELIIAQHALETAMPREAADLRKREGEALIAHGPTWVPIEPAQRRALGVRWRYGFVNAAQTADAGAL